MANLKHNNFTQNTLAIHAGYDYDKERTLSVPLYQSSAYSFESLAQGASRFGLQELGNIYTRLSNPTNDILAKRLAAVEGGVFGVPSASGTSAIFYAILNLAQNGDNILFSNKVYGGTQTLFVHTLKRFGICAKTFDIDDLSTLEKGINNNTKAIFFESLSNPQIAIADVEAITKIAKAHKIATICDNTVATPLLFSPFKHGVDIVVHSLTKYINGHGNSLGGIVIERENLNDLLLGNTRYEVFNTPDESYHGLLYENLAKASLPIFSIRVIIEWLRNTGATLSPQNAWNHIQGLETLELRIKRHSENAQKIAEFLQNYSKIKSVNYPGLENSPYYKLFKKYFPSGLASGLISFEAASFEEAQRICNNLELFDIVANIGDSKSLIIHPASTTHSQLSEAELKDAGITPCTVRLSVGLESSEDLIRDLQSAIEK